MPRLTTRDPARRRWWAEDHKLLRSLKALGMHLNGISRRDESREGGTRLLHLASCIAGTPSWRGTTAVSTMTQGRGPHKGIAKK